MTETYLLQAHGGAGHNFLCCLLLHLSQQPTNKITFDHTGNAHQYAFDFFKQETNYMEVRQELTRESRTEWPYHTQLKPNSKGPLVLYYETNNENYDFDYNKIETLHPGIKYLFTTVDDEDVIKLEANMFFKQFRYSDPNLNFVQHYIYLCEREAEVNPNFRKGLTSLTELNAYEAKTLIDKKNSVPKIIEFIRRSMNVPEYIKDRAYFINFKDILGNPEKVISTCEAITGKKRNKWLVESYEEYVNKQYELMYKDAPWMLPK